jgi:pimeloyl-ACP methyl ester carboxylesterase
VNDRKQGSIVDVFASVDQSIELRGNGRSGNIGPALSIHGAGGATKERSLPVARMLSDRGVSSVAFDHTGHGSTGGELSGQSLSLRLAEASFVADKYGCSDLVVGFSMGGYTALELLLSGRFDRGLLFYPAVYPDAATRAPFGPEFSNLIRMPDAWKSSSVFERLERFSGRISIVIGENDQVIPEELPGLIEKSAPGRVRIQVVPNASHMLLPILMADPNQVAKLGKMIDWLLHDSPNSA